MSLMFIRANYKYRAISHSSTLFALPLNPFHPQETYYKYYEDCICDMEANSEPPILQRLFSHFS